MKKMDYKTTSYRIKDGYIIDIVEKSDEYEAWIYADDICIKSLMFSIAKDIVSLNHFEELVKSNADDYIKSYDDEYNY